MILCYFSKFSYILFSNYCLIYFPGSRLQFSYHWSSVSFGSCTLFLLYYSVSVTMKPECSQKVLISLNNSGPWPELVTVQVWHMRCRSNLLWDHLSTARKGSRSWVDFCIVQGHLPTSVEWVGVSCPLWLLSGFALYALWPDMGRSHG